MATHSSILAQEIPWTEEPGGLESMGSQRVGHTERTRTQTMLDGFCKYRDKRTAFALEKITVYLQGETKKNDNDNHDLKDFAQQPATADTQ